MKKRNLVIITIFIIFILITPIKFTYEDGGTITYNSLTYQIIKWHRIDDDYKSGYKEGTEIYWFPNNYHQLEYYNEHKPDNFYIIINNERYKTNKLSYSWCEIIEKTKMCTEALSIGPTEIEYTDIIEVKPNDKIYYETSININKINIYSSEEKVNYNIEFNNEEEYILVPTLKGKYIIDLYVTSTNGSVNYSFMLNIH